MTAGAWDEQSVGPYRLLNRLGEGGMGVVHLAVGPDERAVAVKVLRAHVAADPDARLRLAREVDTLRRIRHPRVAEVLDADTDGPLPYLVTRFVPGRTLDDLVRERGPMPLDRVVHTGRLLAEALRSIHAAGVVHRDVKPANVMLVDDDPVLIDFGIAHVADESRITMTGLVMGTPGYLSPEVVGGHPVTPATDWWGWGSTLAFAATGRPPFGTGPIEVVLDRVRRGAPDLTGLDERLRTVVATALAADSSTRPPGDWLIGALEGVLRSTGGTPRQSGAASPTAASPIAASPTAASPAAAPVAAGPQPPTGPAPVDRGARTVVAAAAEAPPARADRAAATVRTTPPGAVPTIPPGAGVHATPSAATGPAPSAASVAPTVPHAPDVHAAPTTRTPAPAAPTVPHGADVHAARTTRTPAAASAAAPAAASAAASAAQTVPHGAPVHAAPTTRTPAATGPAAPTAPWRPAPTLVDVPVRPGPPVPAALAAAPAVPATPAQAPSAPSASRAAPRSAPSAPFAVPPSGPLGRPGTPPRDARPTAGPAAAVALRPGAPGTPVAPGAGTPGSPQAAPPPERPTTLLLAGLAAFSALTAVAPGGAVVVLALWMVVARTADRSALAVWRRRYAYGPRSSDVAVTVALVPWRAVVSALMSLFAMVTPLLVGASTAFLAGSALTGGTSFSTPTEPGALGLAGAAAALTAWWGPGGSSMRRGTTWLGRLAVRRRGLHVGLVVFLGFVLVAALLVASKGAPPDFGPFRTTAGGL